MRITMLLQELHHRDVVYEGGCRGHNLIEVGRNGDHFFQSLFQLPGGAEIVEREDESGTGAQSLDLLWLGLLGALQLQVYQLATGVRRLGQNLQLGCDGSAKLAPTRDASAGGNGVNVRVEFSKLLQLGQGQTRVGQVV